MAKQRAAFSPSIPASRGEYPAASSVGISSQPGRWRASAPCASSSRRPEEPRIALTAPSMSSSSMTMPPSSSISPVKPNGSGPGPPRPGRSRWGLFCWGFCPDRFCPDLVPIMALSADQGDGGSQPRASQTLSCLSARTRLRPDS